MKVVTVTNRKGGVGKSTTTMNLAAALSRTNRVVVVDIDPQQTATQWAENVGDELPFDFFPNSDPSTIQRLRDLDHAYDLAFIDTPGKAADTPILQAALAVSDFVILPVLPSGGDLAALVDGVVEDILPAGIPFRLLLNNVVVGRGRGHVRMWQKHIDGWGDTDGAPDLPRLETYIRSSATISDSFHAGTVVTLLSDSRDNRNVIADYSSAAAELTSLWAGKRRRAR